MQKVKVTRYVSGRRPEYAPSDSETDSSEDEGVPDYKIGGYHPVHVGEVLIGRYLVI